MTESEKSAAKPKSAGTKAKSKSTKAAAAKPKAAPAKKTDATGQSDAKSNATKPGAKIQNRRFAGARTAVTVPVAAVVGAANRVGSLVSPVTNRVGGDQVTALRGQVQGILREAEKRGGAVLANERLKNFGDRAEKIQTDLTKALEKQISSLRP